MIQSDTSVTTASRVEREEHAGVPTVEAEREIPAGPEAIWRVVIGYERWPEWSPLFQLVRPDSPELGLAGEWTLNGLIGRIPYTGLFRQIEHRPLEAFVFASIRVSTPYDFIRHTVRLDRDASSASRLSWRIDYRMSGGPGGWIVDRLFIRPRAGELLDRGVGAVARQITGSLPVDVTTSSYEQAEE